MEEAFRSLCECLCNSIMLTVPVVQDVFVLYTDARMYCISVVFQLILFFSVIFVSVYLFTKLN